jgi:hypothetical protein
MSVSPSDVTLYVWLGICTVAVVIGVALEFAEDWQKVQDKREWHERNPWSPLLPKIGFALLVLGLAGEIVLQTWIETRDTAFKIDAARRIEDAYERALEGAPREITDAQREALANLWQKYTGRLDKYSGKVVNIGVVRNIEPARIEEEVLFRGQLESVLLKAHFRVFETKIPPDVHVSSGIYFDGAFDDDEMFNEMAESLRSIGIDARGSGSCVREPCEFWIWIGPKPIGAWWRDEIRPIPQPEGKPSWLDTLRKFFTSIVSSVRRAN